MPEGERPIQSDGLSQEAPRLEVVHLGIKAKVVDSTQEQVERLRVCREHLRQLLPLPIRQVSPDDFAENRAGDLVLDGQDIGFRTIKGPAPYVRARHSVREL